MLAVYHSRPAARTRRIGCSARVIQRSSPGPNRSSLTGAHAPERNLPSADRDGNRFDPRPWVEEALVLLSNIGGGATVLPPVDGAWFNPDTGRLIKEKIILAYTYVQPSRFIGSLPRVRAFLHRMGRQTRQGEVVAEFNNRLYRIITYDTA
jgi:hypothetical protein